MSTLHKALCVEGVRVFFRTAGDPSSPAVLLLHGFPTSSHMFRALIPKLADHYHVVAPDLPGFGFSAAPPRDQFAYTFEHLAHTMIRFTDAIGLRQYALYLFDYGAPIGLRMALAHPERVTALVSQNGNAYEGGLSDIWNPFQAYWKDPSDTNRAALREFLSPASIRSQYIQGVADPDQIAPETYTLDQLLLDRPGNQDIQLDLFGDYATNVQLYPDFHAYFRTHLPPTLAVWGKYDPLFLPAGAEAFRRDNPAAQVHLLPTGHFALETHADEIAGLMHNFLDHSLSAADAWGYGGNDWG